ncbi:hypothetical protein EYV94_01655 [Puteibacter caeruleilacunae]|nr:hypothetical protein EYV94_01655 [Puteibacter caeruleilacunae]
MNEIAPNLTINDYIKWNHYKAAKWAKFLSIVGFVFVGIILIMAFFISSFMGNMPQMQEQPLPMGALLQVIYLVIAIIYFTPNLFLFLYATKTIKALKYDSQTSYEEGANNLRRMFTTIGVFTIIMLALYAIGIIAAIFMGIAKSNLFI